MRLYARLGRLAMVWNSGMRLSLSLLSPFSTWYHLTNPLSSVALIIVFFIDYEERILHFKYQLHEIFLSMVTYLFPLFLCFWLSTFYFI
jgi:hypothetical protein